MICGSVKIRIYPQISQMNKDEGNRDPQNYRAFLTDYLLRLTHSTRPSYRDEIP